MADIDPFDPAKSPIGLGTVVTLVLAGVGLLLRGTVYTKGSHAELMAGKDQAIADRDKRIAELVKELAEVEAEGRRERDRLNATVDKMRDDRDQWRLAAYGEADRSRRADPRLPPPPPPQLSLPGGGPHP